MPASRGEFDRSLEAIEAKVIGVFAMIAEDLPRAAECLLGAPGESARVLAERERVIDALYLEVETLASREILLQAPVAGDLRFLLSVLRVTPELERSHDLVMQVADRAGLAAPAGTLLPASARSPGRWETSPAGCGARRPTPGTAATAPPQPPWPGAPRKWTGCTPGWRPNSPTGR